MKSLLPKEVQEALETIEKHYSELNDTIKKYNFMDKLNKALEEFKNKK